MCLVFRTLYNEDEKKINMRKYSVGNN